MSSTALFITDVRNKLISSVSITFIVLGSVGNLLNIILFAKRSFWKLSPCIPYLLAASFANLVDIYTYVVLRALMGFKISPTTHSSIACKLQLYVHNVVFSLSSWYMVACCADRFVASSRNAVTRRYSNMRVTGRILFIITASIPLIYSQTLYCFDANQVNKPAACFTQNNVCHAIDIIFYFVWQAIGPPTFMLIFGIGTFIHIRQGRQIGLESTNPEVKTEQISSVQTTTAKTNARDNRSVVIMVAVHVIVYVICSIPLLGMKIYGIIPTSIDKSPLQSAIENLCLQITILTSLVDKVFSFFIYTLASKYYRGELFKLVNRRWTQYMGRRD